MIHVNHRVAALATVLLWGWMELGFKSSFQWCATAFVVGYRGLPFRDTPLTELQQESSSSSSSESASSSSSTAKPFGRQDYWQSFYRQSLEQASDSSNNKTSTTSSSSSPLTWYAEWSDLEPFVRDFLPSDFDSPKNQEPSILLPGVGMDTVLRDMYVEGGFTNLSAFDYASESIAYCRDVLLHDVPPDTIELKVADARNLTNHYETSSFDMILEKGTLDAVYIAGDEIDRAKRQDSLDRAISELQRVLKPSGIFWSLSAICTEALVSSRQWTTEWQLQCDGREGIYTTDDGYTSNNIDGTLMVWQKADPTIAS